MFLAFYFFRKTLRKPCLSVFVSGYTVRLNKNSTKHDKMEFNILKLALLTVIAVSANGKC